MSNIDSLNVFFGHSPDSDFFVEISNIKELEEKDVLEMIDLLVKWYPREDIDEEWEEWSKNFKEKEEELKKRKSVIKVFLFIFKEFASEKINETELKEDFNKLNLPLSYLEYFKKKLKSSKDFTNKALRQNTPYENKLQNVDWRIDKRSYNDGTEKNVSVIEFTHFSSKGEKEVTQFDLTLNTLRHLISVLNKIEKKLCLDQKNIN